MTRRWKLAIVEGPDRGREFTLPADQPLVIGRGSDSDTKIRDPALSRVHCSVEVRQSHVVLVDRHSTTGTFVRGIRIDSPQSLSQGGEFKVGDSLLRLESDHPLDAPTLVPDVSLRNSNDNGESVSQPMRPLHELEGEMFFRFRLDRLVSTGRNSLIFKAYDTRRDRLVAVKILKPQIVSTDVQRDRFIRAMRTMLPIVHPNIVRTRKAGRKGPYCWAALEWVDGTSVAKLIPQIGVSGMLEWQEVWRVAVHIGRALHEAGKHRIVHRNVTPSNILRRAHDKSFLLTDLIFSKALEFTDAPALTRPGDVLGELAYMAPEQLLDPLGVDGRCDQYGLGATLYSLLTGEPPYQAGTVPEFLDKLKTSPKNPAESQLGMDERFCDVVMRLIRKSPDQRYESPTSLLKELERVGKLGGIEADWSDWV